MSLTPVTPSPASAPRWYGYFQAVSSTSNQSSPAGRIVTTAQLKWYGVSSLRVLLLTHKETPLPDEGSVTGRTLHEWVVVVDDEDSLPLRFDQVGGLDDYGNPIPAYGVFVEMSYNFTLNGLVSRDYLPRSGQYATTELLNRPDALNAPIGLMVSGVREVISHLDNATWKGPGRMIVYDRESSFGWVTRSDVPDFDQSRDLRWVPGKAGVYERFLLGTGTLDGWGLYAIQNVLVLEFWQAGRMLCSRTLDCSAFAKMISAPDASFVIGFGYDLEEGKVSIGVAGKESGKQQSALAFKEYAVPELTRLQHEQRYVYVGGAPVLYQDGSQAERTCWGRVQPIQGQFTSEGYFTRGSLTQLMQEV